MLEWNILINIVGHRMEIIVIIHVIMLFMSALLLSLIANDIFFLLITILFISVILFLK